MSPKRNAADVVVVGAGAIGCAVARELAAKGMTVEVIDPSPPGSRATWAAGGMLSPLAEAGGPGPFLSLGLRSMQLWPDLAESLEEETGEPSGFDLCGKLMVARDADVPALRERRRWQEEAGLAVEWVAGPALWRLEPGLAPDLAAGLLLVRDGAVDNRALGRMLARAAEGRGARFRVGSAVTAVRAAGGRVAGVDLDEGTSVDAGWVVLAAGAWSAGIRGLPGEVPVRPVRGQMVAYLPERPLVRRVVAGPGAYLIPRSGAAGARLVVGATEEEAGFSAHTTAEGLHGLTSAAEALLPDLRGMTPVEVWAGLRPGTPDDLPILGEDPRLPGLVHATGHYRNGILLTPATAELVARTITEGRPPPAAFRPERFG